MYKTWMCTMVILFPTQRLRIIRMPKFLSNVAKTMQTFVVSNRVEQCLKCFKSNFENVCLMTPCC